MLVDDVAMICEGIICKTCVEMAGMSLKSIFLNNIPMNTIEKNNEDFSDRPRYYFVREASKATFRPASFSYDTLKSFKKH